jgi:hypothetical protein
MGLHSPLQAQHYLLENSVLTNILEKVPAVYELEFHYPAFPPFDSIPNQTNPAHILKVCFLKLCNKNYAPSTPRSSK